MGINILPMNMKVLAKRRDAQCFLMAIIYLTNPPTKRSMGLSATEAHHVHFIQALLS